MQILPLIAARLFGAPLLMHERKLHAILAGLAPRLGFVPPEPRAFEDDDFAAQTMPAERRKPYAITPEGVALVPVLGVLVNRAGQMDGQSTPLRAYSSIERDLRMAMADPDVRGIVMDIDSPGGEAVGAFELSSAIAAMRGRKPIIASANGHAFSAAYAIASAADQLLVMPSGRVGSIGVVALHVDQSAKDEREGYRYEYLFAGAHKVDANPHQPLTDDARAAVMAEVATVYQTFVETVAGNRGLKTAKVASTEARTFPADEAVTMRLADRAGTLADAIGEAAQRAAPQARPPAGRRTKATPPRTEPLSMDDEERAALAAQEAERITAAAAEARTTAASDAAAIVELCVLAGRPQDAAGHITAGRTRGEVSEALLRARSDAGNVTNPAHAVPGTAAAATDPNDPDGWEASIRRVNGTVRQVGA